MSSLTITRREFGPEATVLVPGSKVGSYKVVRELGRGGMATVYEAVHEQIEQRAAIKVLSQAFSQDEIMCTRFRNEARAVNIVRHPGLVSIFEFGELPDGSAFIVMEYLEGESLAARLCRGPLPAAEVLRLGRQIASALSAAHDKGIVHRDLKPGNIMIVADPDTAGGERAKVLDFGIAKVAAPPDEADGADETDGPRRPRESHPMTKTGAVMGTPCYMSPEQCRGEEVSDRSDVYALGVILFEMLSGQVPFDGPQPFEIMAKHLFRPTPTLKQVNARGVPPDLADLVFRMMAKDPQARPSMAQVAQALGPGDLSTAPTLVHGKGADRGRARLLPARAGSRRVLLGAALIGALLVSIVGGAGYLARRGRDSARGRAPQRQEQAQQPARQPAQKIDAPAPPAAAAQALGAAPAEAVVEARPARRRERPARPGASGGAQRVVAEKQAAPQAPTGQAAPTPDRPVYRGTKAAIDTDFPLPAAKE
jgi:tRNA A-37 threonylcarbamoyl transferase component Bud32